MRCISTLWTCDDFNDCGDSSDEAEDVCTLSGDFSPGRKKTLQRIVPRLIFSSITPLRVISKEATVPGRTTGLGDWVGKHA